MIKGLSAVLVVVLSIVCGIAYADVNYTQGVGTVIFDFICFSTKHCSAHVPINSAGAEIGTSGAPIRTDPTGTTTQPVSAVALPLPAGAATAANQGLVSTWGSGTLGAMANYGTSPGAVLVPGVNAFVTNTNSNVATNTDGVAAVAAGAAGAGSPVNNYNYGFNGTTWDRLQVDANKNLKTVQGSQYPATAVVYTASATGTTGATTATLAGASSVTTYICGFSIRANATAATTGNATITGTITGTLNFTQWTAPNASGLGVTELIFTPCVPASATNTSVAVVSAAPGTGGVVSVTAWGYKL